MRSWPRCSLRMRTAHLTLCLHWVASKPAKIAGWGIRWWWWVVSILLFILVLRIEGARMAQPGLPPDFEGFCGGELTRPPKPWFLEISAKMNPTIQRKGSWTPIKQSSNIAPSGAIATPFLIPIWHWAIAGRESGYLEGLKLKYEENWAAPNVDTQNKIKQDKTT